MNHDCALSRSQQLPLRFFSFFFSFLFFFFLFPPKEDNLLLLYNPLFFSFSIFFVALLCESKKKSRLFYYNIQHSYIYSFFLYSNVRYDLVIKKRKPHFLFIHSNLDVDQTLALPFGRIGTVLQFVHSRSIFSFQSSFENPNLLARVSHFFCGVKSLLNSFPIIQDIPVTHCSILTLHVT